MVGTNSPLRDLAVNRKEKIKLQPERPLIFKGDFLCL